MRVSAVLGIGLLTQLTGCNLIHLATHNLIHQPVQYFDDEKVRRKLRAEAEFVWEEVAREHPETLFSKEFHEGFVDGYSDFLDSGGIAGPPPVPPVRYRNSKYFCPEGHALLKDYLAAFKYGSEMACATGKRQFLTVPVLIAQPKPVAGFNIAANTPPPATDKAPPTNPNSIPPAQELKSNSGSGAAVPTKLSSQPDPLPVPRSTLPVNPKLPLPPSSKPPVPSSSAVPLSAPPSPLPLPGGSALPGVSVPVVPPAPATDAAIKPVSWTETAKIGGSTWGPSVAAAPRLPELR